MRHGVRTGTARGTWMKQVPLRHTDDGECMSSSVAWTSVPAPHQASALYIPPSSTHLPHQGRHTADTEFNRPLHSNFSNSLSAWEWKEPGGPGSPGSFYELDFMLSNTDWNFPYVRQAFRLWSLCSSFTQQHPFCLTLWVLSNPSELRPSFLTHENVHEPQDHMNSSCLRAQSISCVQWTCDPMDL